MKPKTTPHPGPLRRRPRRSGAALCLPAAFCLFAALLGVSPAISARGQAATAPVARPDAGPLTGPIAGQVKDPSGAVIPGARVELRRPDGAVVASGIADRAGQFRIAEPAAGEYRLSVALPGFEPLTRTLRIGRGPLAPLTLTLSLASVSTNVIINGAEDLDVAAPDQNQNAATVSSSDMKSLPIFDGDVVATLSAFLDAGVAGEGGTTLIVDGVESKTVGVAPSAIERVSVNQDPYSAQYRQPGKGQVEIVTKSTADRFHGSASFTFRDSALNATNYFAVSKAPEQRRIYEGYLTGPIRPLRGTTFLFSVNRQEEDVSSTVNATVPDPANPTSGAGIPFLQNVAAPTRALWVTMKTAHQINDHHSAYLLYRFYDGSKSNQNIGGQTLDATGNLGYDYDAGYASYGFDMDLTFHDDLAFAPNKINQFSILFERNIDRTVSNQQAAALVVQGYFSSGGAQNDSLQTENNPNLSDIVSWTAHRIHQLKFGVQLPNLGRRVLEDLSNRLGTYTFGAVPNCTPVNSADTHCSPLAAFEQNTPASFTLQQGQSRFLTHFDQPSAFLQDQIQATPRLTVTPGLRYDFQNALPGTMDAVEPRLSLAYVLDKQHALAVRVGSGIYMRRVGVNIGQQLARYQYGAERSLQLNEPANAVCYPNGSPTCDMSAALAAQPSNLFNFEPNVKAPMQDYFGLSVERQLTKKSTVTLGYDGYRGWHALRTIDINAPLPPFVSALRPNPSYSQIQQLQSGGYQKTDGMTLNYRGRIGNVFSGFMQYGWQHNGSNTQWSTFMPENQFAPNAEWSRSDNDQRQRFALFGTFYPDKLLNLGIGFYNYTPTPYSITTGTDAYNDGLTNARPPGVPRNSLNSGTYQDVQLRWGYTFKLRPRLKDRSPTVGLSVSSFNTLNRVNYGGYVGVVTSSDFMRPTTASDPRRLQLAASYNF